MNISDRDSRLTDLYELSTVLCTPEKIATHAHHWKKYEKPKEKALTDHWRGGGFIAVLTGYRNQNLEVLDFDLKNAEQPTQFFAEYMRVLATTLGEEFAKKLVYQSTPSGGQHIFYRVAKVHGNKKISRGKNKQAIVESRGEGGYVIVAPSTGYKLATGCKISEAPIITEEERDTLWAIAKQMEELDEPVVLPKVKPPKFSALSNDTGALRHSSENVWEKFDNEADFLAMLEQDGWSVMQNKDHSKYLLRRPGKTGHTWSADLDTTQEVPLLYVYTTSTHLESEKAYSASSYLIHYRFSGDAKEAYAWLANNGYAHKREGVPEIPETKEEAEDVFTKYKEFKVDSDTVVERPVPIVTVNNVGVLHTGELLTLSGESKSGKSALLSAIIAKVLNPNAKGFDIIKTEKTDFPILHFDTEQPIHRHKDAQEYQIMKRAMLEKYPAQLMSYNLRKTGVKQRKAMVDELVAGAALKYGGVFMLVLDGIADFIMNSNDIEESAGIVTWMLELSTRYNCGVVCVIHLNPTQDGYVKQRGHLGSELQRKTDSLIVVQKDLTSGDERSLVKAQYLRNGGINEFGEHFIKYNTSTHMHEVVTTEATERGENKKYQYITDGIAGMKKPDAIRSLVESNQVTSFSMAKNLIRDLIEFGYAVEHDGKIMRSGKMDAPKFQEPSNEVEDIPPF